MFNLQINNKLYGVTIVIVYMGNLKQKLSAWKQSEYI